MSDETEGVVLHEMTIRMLMTDDEPIITVEHDDDLPIVTALGMLRLTEDTLLNDNDEETDR